jgi:hypothetical protein
MPTPKGVRTFDTSRMAPNAIVVDDGATCTGTRGKAAVVEDGTHWEGGTNRWVVALTEPVMRNTGVQVATVTLTKKYASSLASFGMVGPKTTTNCTIGWQLDSAGLRADGSFAKDGRPTLAKGAPGAPSGFEEGVPLRAEVDTDATTGPLQLAIFVDGALAVSFKVEEGWQFAVGGDGGLHAYRIDRA